MLLRVNVWLWRLAFWMTWSICTLLFLTPVSGLPPIDLWDKAVHTTVFVVLMVLLILAHAKQLSVLPLALLLTLYGVLIEFGQLFVPGRSFSLLDIVANTLGVIIILVATHAVSKIKGRR